MRSPYWLLLNAVAAAFVLATATPANACSCHRIPPPEALQSSVVVFHGVAIEIEHLHILKAPDPATGEARSWIPELNDLVVVTLEVDEYWKGPVTPLMKVYSVARASMCDGYEFSAGKQYLVYAVGPPVAGHTGPEGQEVLSRFGKEPVYEISVCPGPILPGGLELARTVLGIGHVVKEYYK